MVRLDDRYALALYPHVDGAAGGFSDRLTGEETSEVVAMLAALHAVPNQGLGSETFVVTGRGELESTLQSGLGTARGAYVERLHALLERHGDGWVGRSSSTTGCSTRRDRRTTGCASVEYTAVTGRPLQPELLARYELAWSLGPWRKAVSGGGRSRTRRGRSRGPRCGPGPWPPAR